MSDARPQGVEGATKSHYAEHIKCDLGLCEALEEVREAQRVRVQLTVGEGLRPNQSLFPLLKKEVNHPVGFFFL